MPPVTVFKEGERLLDDLLARIYHKYRNHSMVAWPTYKANLELADSVREVHGCIVECGVWRGGMIAGLAEVLGPEREYFLFDSFQGLPPALPIDGVAAIAWQSDTESPSFHNNCAAPESFAREAMNWSGARKVHISPGWF